MLAILKKKHDWMKNWNNISPNMIGDIAVITVHDIYRLFTVSLRSLNWSFIMEAILWRMWRHVITWPLSSLKCIGQRSRRFQNRYSRKFPSSGQTNQHRLVRFCLFVNNIKKNPRLNEKLK
jgi:hypothetical protein